MLHELKIQSRWFERVKAGEKRAEIRKHDRDFQAGDLLDLYEISEYGNRKTHFVERDSKGRYLNAWVDNPPLHCRITHVLPYKATAGLEMGFCILSIQLLGGAE